MIKLFSFALLFISVVAQAAGPLLWGPNNTSLNLQPNIQLTSAGPSLESGAVDPTAVATGGNTGSLYLNTANGQLYVKQDNGVTTNWVNALTSATGWSLTGNGGTTPGTNFLGTTDTNEVQFKTDNILRQTLGAAGQIDFAPNQMFVNGAVTSVVSSYNQMYFGQNFSGTLIPNQFYGPFLNNSFDNIITGQYQGFTDAPNFQSGANIGGYTGIGISPLFQNGSVVQNPNMMNISPNFGVDTALGQNINGIGINPQISSEFLGYSGLSNSPQFSANIANGYNGLSDLPNFQAGVHTQIYKGLQLQPAVQAGASVTSMAASFVGPNISGYVHDLQVYQATASLNGDPMDNVQVINIGPNGTTSVRDFKEINIGSNITGGFQDYVGINMAPNHTGVITGSVVGINSNVGNLTAGPGVQKVALLGQGGSLNVTNQYDTASIPIVGIAQQNVLFGQFNVTAGSPVNGGAFFQNNFSGGASFHDNMTQDSLTGNLGYTNIGFVGQLSVDPTVTAHTVNYATAGAAVLPGSGGVVSNLNFYNAIGLLPSGGTVNATSIAGFHGQSTLCTFGVTCHGVLIDDTSAENYMAKSLVVGGAVNTATNASVGVEIGGTDKSLLNARLTTVQRDALTAFVGMQIYNTDVLELQCYNGSMWQTCGSGTVTSVGIFGSPQLTGAITFNAGSGITLTQLGQNITISGTSSGSALEAIQTITADYNVTTADYNLLADTSLAAISITAYGASGNSGRTFCVKLIGENPATVASSDLIDGYSEYILTNRTSAYCFKTDGSTFYVF